MQNFENKLAETEKTLNNIRGIFEKNKVKQKIKDLEKTLLNENFWKDQNSAKSTIKQKKCLRNFIFL